MKRQGLGVGIEAQGVMTTSIELQVPALLVYRQLVTRAATTACKQARTHGPRASLLSADFGYQVESAVGEAFNNICIHGYRGRPLGSVKVRIETGSDRLDVRLEDRGRAFDPGAVPVPDLEAMPESGMGLFIIRSFMDVVTYSPGPPHELRLIKYFPG